MTPGARVLIADDHPPTRAGVRMALERGGFDVCAEAATAAAAVEAALRERPDVCLLDINMPGSGIWAAAEIAGRLPATTVLMLTVSDADDDLLSAVRAGAAGYLLKGMDPARLPVALQAALSGEAAIPRRMAARLLEELRDGRRRPGLTLSAPRGVELTRREWDVLQLLSEELTTTEIATRLFISNVTVRTHISTILRKLGVSSREDAVRLVRR